MQEVIIGDNGLAIGRFDVLASRSFQEGIRMEGILPLREDPQMRSGVRVSLATGNSFEHQTLYRTVKGRWVLGSGLRYSAQHRLITDRTAFDWLVRNEYSVEDIEEQFPVEPEPDPEPDGPEGPNRGGRPGIGKRVEVPLPADQRAKLTAAAKKKGVSAAELARRYITAGLAEVDFTPSKADVEALPEF